MGTRTLPFHCRPARPEDAPALCELIQDTVLRLFHWTSPETRAQFITRHAYDIAGLRQRMVDPNVHMMVAEDDQSVLGCGALIHTADGYEVEQLYVASRRRGIGRALVYELCTEVGTDRVRAVTYEPNAGGIAFFQALGLTPVALRHSESFPQMRLIELAGVVQDPR